MNMEEMRSEVESGIISRMDIQNLYGAGLISLDQSVELEAILGPIQLSKIGFDTGYMCEACEAVRYTMYCVTDDEDGHLHVGTAFCEDCAVRAIQFDGYACDDLRLF